MVLVNCVFATYFRIETRFTNFFSTSIYTVYLFHQLFLIVLLSALGLHYGEPSSFQILLLATVVAFAGAVFHRYQSNPLQF